MKFIDIIRIMSKLIQILRLEIRLCQNGQYQRAANLVTKKELLFEQYTSTVKFLEENQSQVNFSPSQIDFIEKKQKELDNLARHSKVILEIVIRSHEGAIAKQFQNMNDEKTGNYNKNAQLKKQRNHNFAINKEV